MTDAEATVGVQATTERVDERQVGTLAGTRLDRIALGVVVLSLFFERLDRSLYSSGRSAIPDLTFDLAVLLLSLRYLQQLVLGRLRLGRATRREYAVAGFVVLIPLLGAASLVTLPHWMASSTQVVKSSVHLAFLAYTGILIGRAVSRKLLEFALKLYFWLASGASALAIVQGVDLNAGDGSLTRHLHLIFRSHPNGYLAPCSIFSEPAQLGYTCVAALVIGVLLWRSIGARRAIIGGTLCVVALLMSLAAGAFGVAVVLGIILTIERRPKLSRRGWAVVGALVVLGAAVAVASPVGSAAYHRARATVAGNDPEAQYRGALASASIHIWRIAPGTGVGIGNSRRLLPSLYHYANGSSTPLRFNDANAYLSLLGETGVVGLVAGLALLAAFLWPMSRPARRTTAPQLNTLGVALSFLVSGSFLLPPLWLWGGLRMAEARAMGGSDLFRRATSEVRVVLDSRTIFGRRFASPPLRPVVVLLVLVAAGALSYGVRAQETSSRSIRVVSIAGTEKLTTAPVPGDAALAHADLGQWAALYCRKKCHESLRLLGGRLWEIRARWPSGTACLLLDLAKFGVPTEPTRSVTGGFAGLTHISCD